MTHGRAFEDQGSSRRNARKNTRKSKELLGMAPTPKQNEVGKVFANLNQFKPTQSQQEYISKIKNNVVTFCSSPAGTGKTSAALWYFCREYLNDPMLKIIVTRTPAEVGKDKIGFLPDSAQTKCEPHFASTRKILEDLLGKEKVEADLGKRIFFTIPNYLLGSTQDSVLWLIDEAQLLQPMIMRLLLERIGENSKVVVSGSSSQIYTSDNDRNGMGDAMKKLFNADDTPKFHDFALHRMSVDDVMRSDVVKSVLRAYGEV